VNEALVTNRGTVAPAGKLIEPKLVPLASTNAENVIAALATVNPAYDPVILDVALTAVALTGILAILIFK
jgi:hypothetical protein